jgi:hypothetical protein
MAVHAPNLKNAGAIGMENDKTIIGRYGGRIKKLSGNALAIQSADGRTAAVTNAPLTLGSRDSKAGERLVFNKYGGQYFLSQVWLSVDTGRQLFPTDSERPGRYRFLFCS